MTDAVYTLSDVRQEYRPGVPSLDGIELTISAGEHVAVVGANGSGKSTLLKMLDGLVFPTGGSVVALGRELTAAALEEPAFRREFRSRVGFVFQDADVQLFCSNAYDELAFGPLQLGLSDAEVRVRVAETAEALRITELLDRAMRPDVLLLDEPTNALDPRSQVWLLEVLSEWKAAGKTVVLTTHDLGSAAEFADRMVVLSEQHRVAADGPPDEVLAQRDLLLEVNLIHEHAHRHGSEAHQHAHAHGHVHGHEDA